MYQCVIFKLFYTKRVMQNAFYDYTSTSRCTGSPLLVSFIQYSHDCASNNLFEIDGESTCSPFVGAESYAYKWTGSSCTNATSLDISKWTRNYVVKETYMQSAKCSGPSSQGFAVAADSFCHPLPASAINNEASQYVMANCNGGSPTWKTCVDKSCTQNCTIEEWGGQPCKLMAASASHRIRCLMADLKDINKDTTVNTTLTNNESGDELDDFELTVSSESSTSNVVMVALIIASLCMTLLI